MTRSEREVLIGRFMHGQLDSSQEQDFFIQVAVDKELRQELKAHRTVDSALRKDRDAERISHTSLRARVAAMVAMPVPDFSAHEIGAGGALADVASSPAATSRIASMFSSVTWKWG